MKPDLPQLIIYDWNGTLLDDVGCGLECLNLMLADQQLPSVNLEFYKKHFGFPLEPFYELCGFDLNKKSFEDLSADYMHYYHQELENLTLFHDVHTHLTQIPAKKIILSAYKQDRLLQATAQFQVDHHFDMILGIQDDYARGKKHLLQSFFSKTQALPQECLFIGDTEHDFEVAQSASIPCVLIDRGHQDRTRWIKSKLPIQIASNFSEIQAKYFKN